MIKSEQQIRDKIRDLEEMIELDPSNSTLYSRWIDAMNWVLGEYCEGLDCAWCTNYECPHM